MIIELYKYLESNIKIGGNSKLTRELFSKAKDSEDIELLSKIQHEIHFINFKLINGEALPMHQSIEPATNEKQEYPSFSLFKDDGFKYLQDRAKEANHPLLKARYNQLLWNSSKKHQTNAKLAIDSYLKVLNSETLGDFDLSSIIANSFCLAKRIKYKVTEHENIMIKSLRKNTEDISFEQLMLIEFIATNLVSKNEIYELAEVILQKFYNDKVSKPDYFFAERFLETAIKISSKLGNDTKVWNSKMGEIYEAFGDFRKPSDKTGIVALDMYKRSMESFKIAKNEEALIKVAAKYQKQQSEIRLSRFKIPIEEKDIELLSKYNEKRTDKLLSLEPIEIYDYLVFGNDIFPDSKMMEADGNKRWANDLIYRKMEFDINKNINIRSSASTSLLNDKHFERYNAEMNFSTLNYLHNIFVRGIISGKISYDTIIMYFEEHSWIGQKLEEISTTGETRFYCWLDLLKPSLLNIFSEIQLGIISNGAYNPNFILGLESIVLKFEGILRDIVKRIGVNTIKTSGGETREMFTEDLLRDAKDELSKFYNQNDFLLFYFVFTKQGINLRNDIAHCYMKLTSNYGLSQIYLAIISILRLGKRSISCTKEEPVYSKL